MASIFFCALQEPIVAHVVFVVLTCTNARRYYLAGTLSHGAYADGAPLNSNLMLLQMRKDGWVSLEADYVFNRPLDQLPQATTTAQRVPRCPGVVELLLNAATGVAGYVLIGVRGTTPRWLAAMLCSSHWRYVCGYLAATEGDGCG
eukprot:SAG31_NODE_3483_length_4215_cov_2.188533_2_plen_146_part_00